MPSTAHGWRLRKIVKELNPMLKDFGMFLEMKRKQAYKASAPSTMCYPGSTIPRQLK